LPVQLQKFSLTVEPKSRQLVDDIVLKHRGVLRCDTECMMLVCNLISPLQDSPVFIRLHACCGI
jgi:hypothetical protein